MKIAKSLLSLLIVIIIGIIVYFKVYKVEERRKIQEAEERQLIRFNLDKITRFTLVRPDSSVVFERGIGRIWNITSPIEAEADKEPLYNLFASLDTSDILYNVEDNPEDLSIYELANPEYYMAMEYEIAEPDTLFVGSSTPDNTMTYVRFASEDRILAVTNQLTEFMKKPVRYFRSRSMLNVLADDIIGVEIHRSQEEEEIITLAFNDIIWVMIEPWNHPADPKNMEDFCDKISEARKNTLIAEQTDDLSQYGLDNPQNIINVHLKYGMPSKMILIGNRLKERGKSHLWYAKEFDKDLIFTIENSMVTSLNRTPIWFIDKQPLKFNRNFVNKIILETAENPITFFKDATNNWSVVSPVDKNVPKGTVNSIFSISRFLLIHNLFAVDPTPEELVESGLDKPRITLSFYRDDRELAQVFFGKTFTTDRPNTYFKTSLTPVVYLSGSSVNSSINSVIEEVFSN